ncbi:MAG TPA: hypothetical protein VGI33_10100 [Paenibacillus sp.]|jgi:hypothetical protein
MAMLNGHYILVEDESPSFDVDITDQPVERDIDLSDHVQRKARKLSISGVIVGKDAAQTRAMIVKAQDHGEIVRFTGRTTFTGLLSGFSSKHDYSIADGFTFTLTMKEVRLAVSSVVEKLPTAIKAQAGKITNSGVKQMKSTKQSQSQASTNQTTKSNNKPKGKVQKVKFEKASSWK